MNVYDFDKTIYSGDSTADFFFHCLKRIPSVWLCLPGQAAAFAGYLLGRRDKTAFKQRFYVFLQKIADVSGETERFWEKNIKKIKPWYLGRQKDGDVVISASPEFLLTPVCARLGIKHLMASRVDAKTGEYDGVNCHGGEKVRRFREFFGDVVIDEFYSDSRSDAPLAEMARKSFLVKKDRIRPW